MAVSLRAFTPLTMARCKYFGRGAHVLIGISVVFGDACVVSIGITVVIGGADVVSVDVVDIAVS